MTKPRDPSSLPEGWTYSLLGNGTSQSNPRPAPRTPQGLLSYIEALHREANDNPPPSAPRHAPILTQTSTQAPDSTSLDEAHRAENRWPVIDAERERRRSILENSPALFAVEENPSADGDAPMHRWPALGADLVRKHDREIEEEASRVGVDPDLLRAIMYVEVSQGYYGYPFEQREWVDANLPMAGSLRPVLDKVHWADSILPMNVKQSLWARLLNDGKPFSRRYIEAGREKGQVIDQTHDVLDNPRLNIRAGATLLKRIQDRLEDPSIRKTATLYNGLGQERVTNYRAQVEQAYKNREWLRAEPSSLPIGRGPRPR
jgi:hypothetical protein